MALPDLLVRVGGGVPHRRGRVIEQIVVVGPHIDRDREGGRRVDPSARGVQRELPDRDAHTVRAEVAEAGDALAVSGSAP